MTDDERAQWTIDTLAMLRAYQAQRTADHDFDPHDERRAVSASELQLLLDLADECLKHRAALEALQLERERLAETIDEMARAQRRASALANDFLATKKREQR